MVVYNSMWNPFAVQLWFMHSKGIPTMFSGVSRNRRVAGLFLFTNLVREFYKFYGCYCFVFENYLQVWGSRDSSVIVLSTEEVAFDSQEGEFFVL